MNPAPDAEHPRPASDASLSADDAALSARLLSHVEMLAGTIGPRHFGRPGSIETTLAWLRDQISACGVTATEQTYIARGHHATNLIVDIPGRTDKWLVIGAHYDTVPSTPGADDNASAVAILLETLRLTAEWQPRIGLRFCAYACEEPPFFGTKSMGSFQHAAACRAAGDRLVGMVCLEMLGFFEPDAKPKWPNEIPRFARPLLPKRSDFIAAVGDLRSFRFVRRFAAGFRAASQLSLLPMNLPRRVRAIELSDNRSYWDHGYRALMLTDTSFLRNPHYHQPTDTPETLDPDRMALVVRGVVGGARRICKA
ncbi:MAG: M28 family peptidase [Phycisphaerales bacterium]